VQRAMATARELSATGLALREIAKRLTEAGHRTRAGGPITHTQVRRWLARDRDQVVRPKRPL
jgi:hypothetical protein